MKDRTVSLMLLGIGTAVSVATLYLMREQLMVSIPPEPATVCQSIDYLGNCIETRVY